MYRSFPTGSQLKTGALPESTMLLGLGNPILGDDGIGCMLAELVGDMLGPMDGLEVLSASVSPVRLVDIISGFHRLLVLDSVTTRRAEPGTLMEVDFTVEGLLPPSSHHFSVHQIPEIASALGLQCPRDIVYLGIEIEPPREYGDRLSPLLEERLPSLAEEVIAILFKENDNDDQVDPPRGELAV